jgi:hypothetical protein
VSHAANLGNERATAQCLKHIIAWTSDDLSGELLNASSQGMQNALPIRLAEWHRALRGRYEIGDASVQISD